MLDEPSKEPFGPGCRDYFWVLSRLVENLLRTVDGDNNEDGCAGMDASMLSALDIVDIDQLCQRLCCGITARPFYERRHGGASQPAGRCALRSVVFYDFFNTFFLAALQPYKSSCPPLKG